jgi:Holin of 3TMs, for gene-transfer release
MLGIDDAIGAGAKLIDDAIDKIWPNPEDKAKAEAISIRAAADAAVVTMQAQMSVMLAEEQSQDKWTSRARPSFLYVVYLMILTGIPMGVLWAFEPAYAERIAIGLQRWLQAIPSDLWSLFSTGYLGYVAARTVEKHGGVMPTLTGKK